MAVCSRLVLNQSTYSAVASSTSASVFQGPSFLISSVLYRPIVDSISALSRASPTVPMDASIPASIRCAVNAKLVYLRSGVAVMHQARPGRPPVPVAPPQRHLQGIEHQLGPL